MQAIANRLRRIFEDVAIPLTLTESDNLIRIKLKRALGLCKESPSDVE